MSLTGIKAGVAKLSSAVSNIGPLTKVETAICLASTAGVAGLAVLTGIAPALTLGVAATSALEVLGVCFLVKTVKAGEAAYQKELELDAADNQDYDALVYSVQERSRGRPELEATCNEHELNQDQDGDFLLNDADSDEEIEDQDYDVKDAKQVEEDDSDNDSEHDEIGDEERDGLYKDLVSDVCYNGNPNWLGRVPVIGELARAFLPQLSHSKDQSRLPAYPIEQVKGDIIGGYNLRARKFDIDYRS